MTPVIITVLLIPVVIIVLINFKLLVLSKSNGLSIGIIDIACFRLRKIDPSLIIDSMIRLFRSGLIVDSVKLQEHYLSGGDLDAVVEALISSSRSKLSFDFEYLCRLDLAGRDVLGAIESYVSPTVIHCPSRGESRKYMVGVSKDGIRLGVQMKVTVRADLNKLIGGAGEATVRARVGEGVISSIGKEESHKEILANPEIVSKRIQDCGLLAGTAYELVSVDILEIEIIDNIGAQIQTDQSEADKKVAQAASEAKKAEALAVQQEMRAKKRLMESQLVLSKSTIPSAMSSAYYEGNLGAKGCPVAEVSPK
jgi:uncharacterized protein YqfA (UPF0365 family)